MIQAIQLTRGKGYTLSDKDISRFWSKVDIRGADECWEWQAALLDNGYGVFGIGGHSGTAYLAHRIAWTIANGREPLPGMEIAHAPVICHNRACCNPSHLSEKTRKENNADMVLDGTVVHLPRERVGTVKHPERVARGEQAGNAKLTQAKVDQIRELRNQNPPVLQRIVAAMFGIKPAQVSKIENGEQWKQ